MAKIHFKADKTAESAGGGQRFSAAPRGIYTLQIAEHSDGEVTTGGKYVGTPITKFVLEIADEGPHFGKKVWHNVTWIPRGSGEKANGGHGIAVHFLHAVEMDFDGEFDFDESDFQGRMFRALLGVETYTKGDYVNEKNVIEEIYSEGHPEPKELPAARPAAASKPANGKPAAAPKQATKQPELDDVPF